MGRVSRRILILGGAVTTYGVYRYLSVQRQKNFVPSFQSEEDPRTTIVVGTGIIGLTTAYYLAKSGRKVCCIERREDVALETSFKNGALICPSLLTPWANADVPKKYLASLFKRSSTITSTKVWPSTFFSLKFYRWIYEYLKNCTTRAQIRNAAHLLTLSMYSRQCLDDILNEDPIAFSRCSTGSLQLAVDPTILEELIEESKHVGNMQIFRSADEVIKHEPMLAPVKARLCGGVFSAMDTNGNIHEFCRGLKKILAEKYGVTFLFNVQIDDLHCVTLKDNPSNAPQRRVSGLVLSNGDVLTNIANVVLANGNYVMPLMDRLKIYIPVYPVKGYVVEIKTPPNIALPSMNLVDDANKLYISALKPTAEQGMVRVSGLAEFAGWEDIGVLSEPERAQYLYEQTIYWLPHLAAYEKAFHSCSRPVSADDVPIIGRCGNFDNLFVNCGHGSKGWTLAFGSAAVLANVVNRKDGDIDSRPYSPNRFL